MKIFRIISYKPHYLDPVSLIHKECFEEFWTQTTLAETLSEDSSLCLVAALKAPASPLIGFIIIRILNEEAEILTLAVSPQFRRFGIAKALLHHALSSAYQKGVQQVYLEVAEDNQAALNLYTLFNAQKYGERSRYYRSNKGKSKAAILFTLKKNNLF